MAPGGRSTSDLEKKTPFLAAAEWRKCTGEAHRTCKLLCTGRVPLAALAMRWAVSGRYHSRMHKQDFRGMGAHL